MSEAKKSVELVVKLNVNIDWLTTTPQDLIDYFESLFTNSEDQKVVYENVDIQLMQIVQENAEPLVLISKKND